LALARRLLCTCGDAKRRKETVMSKMFKVISAVERDGKTKFWMRVGSAFVNRDNSINVYLDAVPKSMQFQLREPDERDLPKTDNGERVAPDLPLIPPLTDHALTTDVPF
jgi:hypothetical protein